jgi:hypothetical protein
MATRKRRIVIRPEQVEAGRIVIHPERVEERRRRDGT